MSTTTTSETQHPTILTGTDHSSPLTGGECRPTSPGGECRPTSPSQASDSSRERRPEQRVDTDPRTTGFIIGRNHENLKTQGAALKDQFGESVFIKYIQPPNKQWGFWKVLSRSEEALAAGVQWIRQKEQECHQAIADGSYVPRAPRDSAPRDTRDSRDNRSSGNRDDRRGRPYSDRPYRNDRGYGRNVSNDRNDRGYGRNVNNDRNDRNDTGYDSRNRGNNRNDTGYDSRNRGNDSRDRPNHRGGRFAGSPRDDRRGRHQNQPRPAQDGGGEWQTVHHRGD